MTSTAATVWAIDTPHSSVEFAVKLMMFATFKGHLAGVKGEITIDKENIANSTVKVEIDAASVDTRDEKRDGHLKSADFFDVENFPTLNFTSTSVEQAGGSDLQVTGDLTIRGITRAVVLAVELNGEGKSPWGQSVVSYSATTTINRKDFGLNWNAPIDTGGALLGDDVKVTLEVGATS